MQLEDYFDFHAGNDIRLKGHRIGIESVLYEYIHRAQTPYPFSDAESGTHLRHNSVLSAQQKTDSWLYDRMD